MRNDTQRNNFMLQKGRNPTVNALYFIVRRRKDVLEFVENYIECENLFSVDFCENLFSVNCQVYVFDQIGVKLDIFCLVYT